MRSNSLDIQLKKTEKELKQNEQEIADQQQLHDLTVKELELAKAAHKIAQEECQQHKNKVRRSTTCSCYPRLLHQSLLLSASSSPSVFASLDLVPSRPGKIHHLPCQAW